MLGKSKLSEANLLALKYYMACLDRSKAAKEYLFNRISPGTAKRFSIGYSPQGGLIGWLNHFNVSTEDAKDVGLIKVNILDKTATEFFTKRIVFPLISNKRIIGFAGRTIINDSIKYLNSKSTVLYDKSGYLYLLDIAKKSIYEHNCCFLVEGYFDVLCMYDHGINNVVATCGTALTPMHARLLRRWTNHVIVCYDGDSAGEAAAKKAASALKLLGIYGGTVSLKDGYDPADYVTAFGADKFNKIITRFSS